MAQAIGPSSPWCPKNFAADLARIPKGTLAQLDQCKRCTMGKFVKTTFHLNENRASVILERVHTNVCGPFPVASTTKHRYYVIFVDEFSRKFWIFFM